MNKKLLKSIVCIAWGIGVATSIPFAVSSCGNSSGEDILPGNPLPDEVYIINASTHVLEGFTQAFLDNPNTYDKYDTIQIPDTVTSVKPSAFENASSSQIPPFISHINFSKNSKCTSIGYCAFQNCRTITSVYLPSSLTSMGSSAFQLYSNLTSIVWDGWKGKDATSVSSYAFTQAGEYISDSSLLKVKVTNPIGNNDSEALVTYLKANAGLPNNWAASN